MHSTLSASQESPSEHHLNQSVQRASQATLTAELDHLSVEVPAGEALQRLSPATRLRLRFALWLLLRTSVPGSAEYAAQDPADLPHQGADRETAASAHGRATAERAARAAYERLRLLQASAPRAL